MADADPTALTRALAAARDGDTSATDALLGLVYDELRAMARAQMRRLAPGHTLQATALVHEAWLRLVPDGGLDFQSRACFFGAAGRAMRNVLVDQARRKQAQKRGGGQVHHVDVDMAPPNAELPVTDVLAIDEALTRLESEAPRKVRLVELRVFAGMSMPEIADALGTSLSTTEREWRFTRAWLAEALEGHRPLGAS